MCLYLLGMGISVNREVDLLTSLMAPPGTANRVTFQRDLWERVGGN